MPVQSAICSPSEGDRVERARNVLEVSGYAYSGGGRGIVRVDVTTDGGESWYAAQLQQDEQQTLVGCQLK